MGRKEAYWVEHIYSHSVAIDDNTEIKGKT